MYTHTINVIVTSDVASIVFYRWKEGSHFVTFIDKEGAPRIFIGRYKGDDVIGTLHSVLKDNSIDLGETSVMHRTVLSDIISKWQKLYKEIESHAKA